MQYLLDTNVLRNLVAGKNIFDFKNEIEKVRKMEKNKNSKFLFSNAVAIELLNHLTEGDNAKNECFKALCYKVELCGDFTNKLKVKGILAPEFNELLSLYFFGRSSTHFILNENLLKLSHDISKTHDFANVLIFKNKIEDVIHYKKIELQNILQNIEDYYLASFSDTKDWSVFKNDKNLKDEFSSLIENKSFHNLLSNSLIKMTFDKELKLELSITEFQKFNSDFCISLDFFILNIWKKFVEIEKIEYFSNPSSDPKKRWNSFYDTQIIMASEFENSKGRKTKLVTTEKKILLHFKKHGKEECCMSYDDFINEVIN